MKVKYCLGAMGGRIQAAASRVIGWVGKLPAWYLALAAVGLLAIEAVVYWQFCMDDTYIILRFARNLAGGRGVVFNAGERVEGYSSPLLVFAVGGLGALGVPYLLAAKLLGLVAAGATVVLVFLVGRRLAAPGQAGLAALALSAYLPFAAWSVSGLETALYALAIMLVVLGVVRQRPLGSGLAVGLAALARPEGLVLLPVALPFTWPRLGRYLGGFGLAFIPFMLWRLIYYGDLLPNTFYAKMGGSTWERLPAGFTYLGDWLAAQGWLWLLAVGVGLVFALTRPRGWRLCCLGVVGAQAAFSVYSGGDWMPCFRFLMPVMPVLMLLLVGASPRRLAVPMAILLMVGGLSGAHRTALADRMRGNYVMVFRPGSAPQRVGDWLQAHGAGKMAVASQIGYLCWHCPDVRVIDFVGLTDRTIAHSPGNHAQKANPQYLRRRAPEFVVHWMNGPIPQSGAERFWFAERDKWFVGYREVARFRCLPQYVEGGSPEYVIFRR